MCNLENLMVKSHVMGELLKVLLELPLCFNGGGTVTVSSFQLCQPIYA